MPSDKGFASSMQAKRFLVSRIVEEARRQNERLSDLEEKMLYFSETYPTLPDMMDIAEQFEKTVDSSEYEAKIKRLSNKAYTNDRKAAPEQIRQWKQAVVLLKTEDHYLLVMLDVPRSMSDVIWLIVASFAAVVFLMAVVIAKNWLQQHVRGTMRDTVVVWSIAAFLAFYYFTTTRVGKKFTDRLGDVAEYVVKRFQ